MLIAEFNFGQALLTVLTIFLFVAWFWILISIIGDLFRDSDTSGWAKAVRAIEHRAAAQSQMDSYVRKTAGSSPAEELGKLSDLKDKGTLSEAEFERAKAKLLD